MNIFGENRHPLANRESMSSFVLNAKYREVTLGIGTAFLYYFNEDREFYLVTNWHNVTGRNPVTLELIHSDGAIPDKIEVKPHATKLSGDGKVAAHSLVTGTIPLYQDEEMFEPIWFEHPEHGRKVDVIAIPLKSIEMPKEESFEVLNRGDDKILISIGMDVAILGFPRGISGGRFPIWKRGTIASEPFQDLDSLPKFYVDCATREGMSGSPVIACVNGPIRYENNPHVGQSNGMIHRFLGIYSGRVGNDTYGAQLGVVWKESALAEIIRGQKIGVSSIMLTPKSGRANRDPSL